MPLVPEPAGRVFLREPVPGLLLEVEGGIVPVDTGFDGALVRDRALYQRFWGAGRPSLSAQGPVTPSRMRSPWSVSTREMPLRLL